MMYESKFKHFKSITHETLDNCIIRKHIILNPNCDQIDEIMKEYINVYN